MCRVQEGVFICCECRHELIYVHFIIHPLDPRSLFDRDECAKKKKKIQSSTLSAVSKLSCLVKQS